MNFESIKTLRQEIQSEIWSCAGVHAIGYGLKKDADGKPGGESVLLVYVDSDISAEKLMNPENSLLSLESLNDIEVIVSPPLTFDILWASDVANVANDTTDQGRYRPLVGGIQLSLNDAGGTWFGTLGSFVKSTDESDNELYILSNQHVLPGVGLAAQQPRRGTGNIIGMVTSSEKFNNIDAALAVVNNRSDVAINQIQGVGTVSETHDTTVADLGERVFKRGRTTLLTNGVIQAVNLDINVGGTMFTDCVLVQGNQGERYSAGGDSGSATMLQNGNKLLGLHFAGNGAIGGIGVFCKINNIFERLGVKLPD